MTVREIGISTTESETTVSSDPDGGAFQGRELKKRYPLLEPGRALIDLETSSLIEFFHAPEGRSEPMAGMNQYDDEKGFDEGHVIVQKWIAYRAVDCPTPNQNGEIPVLNDRPEQSELTYKNPDAFEEDVIQRDGRRPLVMVERPSVAYEEAILGESFEVLGWYRPWADETSERLAPVEAMTEEFDGLGTDGDLKQVQKDEQRLSLDGLNAEVSWEDVDDPSEVNVMFFVSGKDIEAKVVSSDTEQDIHMYDSRVHQKYNKRDIKVKSPYEAKDLIKQGRDSDAEYDDLGWERAHPTWNAEHEVWEIDGDAETVQYAIVHFAAHGFPVTVSGEEVERMATNVYTYVADDDLGETGLVADESLAEFGSVEVESDLNLETMTYEGDTPRTSIHAVNADGGLLALDNALSSDTQSHIEGLDEATVPPHVTERWQVSVQTDDEALHEWYSPRSGARIKVVPVTNADVERTVWGGPVEVEREDGQTVRGEYGVVVEESGEDAEMVASLADEEAVTNTVVTHMQALA